MSLQDLFKKQNSNSSVVSAENATSSAEYVESVATIKRRQELNDQFVPRLDYSVASNFAKFGSAELYYEFAFKRIYNEYPYDGTEQEKLEFRLSSSYLDDYIFENEYPRTNGHVIFSYQGSGSTAIHRGYGTPTTPEFILTKGGPNTGSLPFASQSIHKVFEGSNNYGTNGLGSSLELNFDPGVTIEFWLKKSSFDTDATQKEVIFDLWNNQPTSSANYGRLTIALTSSATAGANPFLITAQSGAIGFSEYQPTISNFTTASVADGNWHHYALTIASQSAGIQTKIYVDGVKRATDSNGSVGIGNVRTINGNISTIGGLVRAPSGTSLTFVTGSGKLSGSLDEFRYWKEQRSDKQIANTFFIPIGGGTNEFDYNRKLGLYYKFNEGITQTASVDRTVLDYSGRVANGAWTGYAAGARQTTSAMVQSGYARSEFKDPIIYSFHPDVTSSLATLKATGSLQDNEGTSKMMALLPGWLQEKDRDNYDNQVKKFTQIMASYFDNLNAQIDEFNNIFDEKYPTTTEEPYPFAQNLLQSRGFVVPELFTDGDLVNYLLQKDDNEVFEMNISDVKNRIYHNIYNNLTYILKSKGTEKSFRNLLRCFGIDSEVMRLSLYADDSTYTILDNYEYASVEKKAANFNNRLNLEATIFNTTSSTNSSLTYIPTTENERYSAFTTECEAIFPLQLEPFDDGYFPKLFNTASIYGFHRPDTGDPADYTWKSPDRDLKIYAVKPENESKDVYFVATSSYAGFNLTSPTFFNVYENNKWNFAVRIRNRKYPYTFGLSGSTGDEYFAEFVGFNSEGDTTKNSFSVSASISNTLGRGLLTIPKRIYAGAHRTNFTGSTLLKSDVLVTDVKFWQSYLDDETIQYHSYNPDNVGTKTPFRPDNVNTGIEKHELTDYETLALHWRFDTLTGSNSSGEFTGFDFSSGSAENLSRNLWLGSLVGNKYPFIGQNFATSSTKAIDRQFIYSAKQRNFGVLMSSDGVTIKNDANTLLFTDDDVSDNYYAFEKSYHGVISQEMLNIFASLIEFNDLIGYPIDGYKRSYKEMEKLARLFFEKMENRIEPEKFFEFYKWIDTSIMYALGQLFPASAKFSETSRNVIESHVLERNKLDRKFPILIDVSATEGYARGINELFYNWKFGHAPINGNENENCFWQKRRKERSDITDRQTLLDNLNSGNNVKHLAKFTDAGVAYAGSTYALRNFSKLHKFSVQIDENIHGGTNYGESKNRDIIWDAVHIHGPVSKESPTGIPQNVLAVGMGEGQGTEAFIDCVDEESPNEKRKWRITTVQGRRSSTSLQTATARNSDEEYKAVVKGAIAWPTNLISGNVRTGYQKDVVTKFKESVIITNIHSDTFSPSNEIGMQGPFTQTWVGGHQSRHVDLNRFESDLSTINNLDDQYSRPEGWRLLLRECPDARPAGDGRQTGLGDGAMGFVGPDYGGPYPDISRQYASRYRDVRVKRPVNVKNIKTTTDSPIAGNYSQNYEVLTVAGKSGNNIAFRGFDPENRKKDQILPDPIFNQTPDGTNYQTLVAFSPGFYGNVFGDARNFDPDFDNKRISNIGNQIFFENNRQVEENTGRVANGSFNVSGAQVSGVKATGAFTVLSTLNNAFNNQITPNGKIISFTENPANGNPTINIVIDATAPITSDSPPNFYIGTGSTTQDTTFFTNIITAITGNTTFGTASFDAVQPFGETIQFRGSNNSLVNLFESNTSQFANEFDNTEEDYYFWIKLSASFNSNVETFPDKVIYQHKDSSGIEAKRLFISGGSLHFHKFYSGSLGNATSSYEVPNFESTYAGLNRYMLVYISNSYPSANINQGDSKIYINNVSQSIFHKIENTGVVPDGRSYRRQSNGLWYIGGIKGVANTSFAGDIGAFGFFNTNMSSTERNSVYNNGYYQPITEVQNIDSNEIIDLYQLKVEDGYSLGERFTTGRILSGTVNNIHLTASMAGTSAEGQRVQIINTTDFNELERGLKEARFALIRVTSSYAGTAFNTAFSFTNGSVFSYFKFGETGNTGSTGGTNSIGAQSGDSIRIQTNGGLDYSVALTSSTPSANVVSITGSNINFWDAISSSIKDNTDFETINIESLTDGAGNSYAKFNLTASGVGRGQNGTFAYTNGGGGMAEGGLSRNSFFVLSNPGGGADPVTYYNIIERVRDDLTSSNSIITTRFSAPGGPEIQSRGFLDVRDQELSAYNALPFRNLLVRGSGSGEAGRMRVNDIHNDRYGLYTHLRRHSGQFGFDTGTGAPTTAESYVTVPSFHKIQRNDMKRLNFSTGESVVTGTIYNNGFYQSCIPQSDFQYAWVTGSIGEDLTQRILGFAPAGGFVTSSIGFVDAIVFPSSSNISIRSL
jgi:hypothetical protein